jgi:hypothetical protein
MVLHRPVETAPFFVQIDCYADRVMKSVPSQRRSAVLFTAHMLTIACCTMMVSCTSVRPNVVVYDEQWSRAAGIANLNCAPTIREPCQTEAIADVVSFSKALSSAFQISPECKGVEFIVDSAVGSDPQGLKDHLLLVRKATYWRLRVDYRPRLIAQPFSLDLIGGGGKPSRSGGESSAKDMMTFACKMSKSNGVVDYW